MEVIDIKAFIPSRDYDVSKAFYTQIGFKAEFVSSDLTLFENGSCQLLLQRFYNEDLANNFMLQICVTDIDAAHALCTKAVDKLKISEVTHEPWGKVFYLWGPSGELLHMTELTSM
ncbi:lactoylglutathione lyase [Alteromonas sp. 1_MG-2023]|uniref:VOC family protein n=1 Tax=Alteromonas sp. 1_MG-2023 TaxID=3062669 RepID=UPI0026E47515|nr:VOC family protein [Alteromonas sp. 1_MG-2023]MDO6569203.1 lactoylglutathione lyase [Alteromonas sp. 1_MG-2023]